MLHEYAYPLLGEPSQVLARYTRTCSLQQNYDCGREHAYNAPALRDHLANSRNMQVNKFKIKKSEGFYHDDE